MACTYIVVYMMLLFRNFLRNFQHENLVKLYGVCTAQGPVFIIQELMTQGVCVCVCVCVCVSEYVGGRVYRLCVLWHYYNCVCIFISVYTCVCVCNILSCMYMYMHVYVHTCIITIHIVLCMYMYMHVL